MIGASKYPPQRLVSVLSSMQTSTPTRRSRYFLVYPSRRRIVAAASLGFPPIPRAPGPRPPRFIPIAGLAEAYCVRSLSSVLAIAYAPFLPIWDS